ncbi:MAG: ATP-binding protein [Saprospiraceae bacterium]|nr:ATP-binding protein [Saprospiraceae bacterium]
MINRRLEKEIVGLLKTFPCVAILGPRQVGKTTLAKKIAGGMKNKALFLDVERPSDRIKLTDAESYLKAHAGQCIILDEIQFMPDLFNVLRPLIDDHRRPGRFLITGSASPALVRGLSESLAGRIAYMELTPVGISELPNHFSMQHHWFTGGFPLALSAKTNNKTVEWLDHFIKSYVERDLNQLFQISFSPTLIRNFWTMIAFNNGGLLNAENYARALGVTGPTINRYLDYLEGAFLIRKLLPWHTNLNKRLVKSPKLYIRDSGLLHRLAGIDRFETLQGNLLIGASWEGYVIEQISQVLSSGISLFFYRTHDGAEMDLVLIKNNKVSAAIEIKLNNNALPEKGFYEAIKALSPFTSYILTPAGETFPIGKNIFHCSLISFIKMEIGKL